MRPPYLVRPQSEQELWSFLRRELQRGQLRIEAPLGTPEGAMVQIMVAHPRADATWTAHGQVLRCEVQDAGHATVDVQLVDLNEQDRERFRIFIGRDGNAEIDDDEQTMVTSPGAAQTVEGTEPKSQPKSLDRTARDTEPAQPRWSSSPGLFSAFFEEAAANGVEPPSTPNPSGPNPAVVRRSRRSSGSHSVVVTAYTGSSSAPAEPFRRASSVSPGWKAPRCRPRIAEDGPTRSHRAMSTSGTDPMMERAIALARARIAKSPGDRDASTLLARLLLEQGRPQAVPQAMEVLAQASSPAPNEAAVRNELAGLLARAGRYKEAEAYLQETSRLGFDVDSDVFAVIEAAGSAGAD